jgi:hypothetical protein
LWTDSRELIKTVIKGGVNRISFHGIGFRLEIYNHCLLEELWLNCPLPSPLAGFDLAWEGREA